MRTALGLLVLCLFLAGCSESENRVVLGPDEVKMPEVPAMAQVLPQKCSEARDAIDLKNTGPVALPEGIDFTLINRNTGEVVGKVDFDHELAAGAALKYYIKNGSAPVTLLPGVDYDLVYPGLSPPPVNCG